MSDLLGQIPLASFDRAVAESGQVQIDLNDYDAASALAGLDRPDASDIEASLAWARDLTFMDPVDAGGTGFVINPPLFPEVRTLEDSPEVAAAFGFSFFDINRSAVLLAPPQLFAVVEGDVALASDLSDLGDGVFSAGEGDDFVSDLSGPAAGRPLGRPLRLASNDGKVVASRSTPAVEEWLAGGPSMLDEPSFAAGVEALDSAGSVSAYLANARASDFEVLGIGVTMVDGQAANAIAYVFADDASAAAALPSLEANWRDGELVGFETPVSDFFTVRSVEQRGAVVLVVATVTDDNTTRRAIELFLRQEPLMTTV